MLVSELHQIRGRPSSAKLAVAVAVHEALASGLYQKSAFLGMATEARGT